MKITLSHGSGGVETAELIDSIFLKHFRNEHTRPEDAAVLPFPADRLAFTTDSFVVRPMFFPGGDIGRLAVCGTVNDILTTGGTPLYLSASFIIEEGCDTGLLESVARSMRAAADEAGVRIVTGDTKVIEGSGGLTICTAGAGAAGDVSARNISAGDAILVSGTLGDHHACILSRRMGIQNGIESDAAPLTEMVYGLKRYNVPIHCLRDITRGGLATVLNEVAAIAGLGAELEDQAIPISDAVGGLCRILGLDPLYMGNEGKMLVAVPEPYAGKALELIKKSRYGASAAVIGSFVEGGGVTLRTAFGGLRQVPPLSGEGLPRIC